MGVEGGGGGGRGQAVAVFSVCNGENLSHTIDGVSIVFKTLPVVYLLDGGHNPRCAVAVRRSGKSNDPAGPMQPICDD